ncbi:PKD domain-containing protein [Danxiaibacter flavus]|uniref:PKD domain-containing protein n=1 Tax=Danxiaibacter flavus TaxID=3049108 RepID=A0ABV3ZGB5_9BACT|nr:PKD domain-containing protein [Chitinophagaceae bacterium DXS]
MPGITVPYLPNYKRTMIVLLSFAIALNVSSQTFTPITTYISPNIGGYWEYLPADYATSNKTYPLLLFFHGKGERGSGSQTDLQLILTYGPPKVIADGLFPKTITVGGKNYSYIVISPQLANTAIETAQDFNILMNYIRHHYRIDDSRVYLSGLSLGAGRILYSASSSMSDANSVAGIVSASTDWSGDTLQSSTLAATNMPLWFATNTEDPTIPYTYTLWWYDFLSAYTPPMNPKPLLDTFGVSGHDSWTKLFDPTFRPRGVNVYEWLLQYTRGTDTATRRVYPYISVPDTVTLPVKGITLDGSASSTDSGALIISYKWKVLSGPAGYQLNNSTASIATLTKLSPGKYTIQLTVSNNKGVSGSSNAVVVTVQGPNPLAVAQAPSSISLPVDSVTLDGSASYDPLGTIASYNWSCIGGPSGYVFNSTTNKVVKVTSLTGGIYDFVLKVKNNRGYESSDTVSVLVKNATVTGPVAVIRNPGLVTGTSATLDASASYTAAGRTITKWQWNYISGPKNYIIENSTKAITKVSNLVNGTYTFQVKVSDAGGSGSGRVTFTVNLAAATVNAVIDGPGSISVDSVVLDGRFSSSSNGNLSYNWAVISGPAGYTINNTIEPVIKITGMKEGTYKVTLTVKNTTGQQDTDTATIIVNPALPTVHAVINAPNSITLPVDSVALDGSSSSSSNGGLTYRWVVVSGPTGYVLSSTVAPLLKVTKMKAGTYVFALIVKNGTGQLDSTSATVVVNQAAITGPVAVIANPGPVTTSTVTLDASGSYTVPGRTITSYLWNYMAGPKNAIIQSPTQAITAVTNLTNGTYTYRVKVTDKAGSNSQTVTFTVTLSSGQRIANAEQHSGSEVSSLELNEPKAQQLKLSPVPTNDQLNLSMVNDLTGKVTVHIADMSGRIVLRKSCADKTASVWKEKVNVTNLSGGSYFVTVAIGNETFSGRFIKLSN